jgi:putative phosphoesterase
MRLGILADTHDKLARTRVAVGMLRDAGAEALVHCGDLTGPPIVEVLAALPCWFVFGNNDAHAVPALERAAAEFGPVCLGWGGVVELGGRRVGLTHGHMARAMRQVLAEQPEFVLSGHSHCASDTWDGTVRWINPGALHRADEYTVALLELVSGELQVLRIER